MVGAGQTKFGNHPLGLKGMWAEAIEKAVQSVDNGFDSTDVEEAFIGSIAFGGSQLGNTAALLTEHSGMEGVSVRRVENACASVWFCSTRRLDGHQERSSRCCRAGGIEKMNDLSASRKRYWLGVSGDTEWERLAGLTFPGTYALTARRYFTNSIQHTMTSYMFPSRTICTASRMRLHISGNKSRLRKHNLGSW